MRLLMINKGKNNFTLIEMLVVISIIAILAAMLLPALQNAVKTGLQVSCGNNMRNCYLGINNYATDHNTIVIRGLTDSNGNKSMWPGYITGYNSYGADGKKINNAGLTEYIEIGDHVLDCPARSQNWVNIGKGSQGYGMPECEGLNSNKKRLENFLTSVKVGTPSGTLKIIAMQRCPRPGRFLLLADTTSDNPSWRSGGIEGSKACFSNWGVSSNYGGVIQTIHSERANGLFFDGHVESRDYFGLYNDPDTYVRQTMSEDYTLREQLPTY